MTESTRRSMVGLKLMVLGVQVAFFGRHFFQSVSVMALGGVVTVLGAVVR